MSTGKLAVVSMAVCLVFVATSAFANGLTPLEELGKLIYFDENLSMPAGQSCASCHHPSAGFADPDSDLPVSQGVLPKNRFGNRNSPSAAYMAFSPVFHFDEAEGLYIGGQFWDGRAATLEEQAKGPFLNLLEMNNPNKQTVILEIIQSDYADLFRAVFGNDALDDVENAYELMAHAIATFERSHELNQFNSKYDAYLMGMADLTDEETSGLELFEGKALCSACHPSEMGADGELPLFTDFSYDNLGVPKNPDNPFYNVKPRFNPDGEDFVDYGLGGVLGLTEEMGKMKVPTLRNIAVTPPYMHNGFFDNLRDVVDFYNTRDVAPWPPPEVAENVNTDELGDLGLTDDEVDAIVAFMMTLTDGWMAPMAVTEAEPDVVPVANPIALSVSPNPFNPVTQIEYALTGVTDVEVAVYDVAGRLVRSLENGSRVAGPHRIAWDGTNAMGVSVASGVYFIRLTAGEQMMVRKAVLMR